MDILKAPHPLLYTICRSDFVVRQVDIENMFYLLEKHKAFGLAAPQVGINGRFFITNWGEVFVKPSDQREVGLRIARRRLLEPSRQDIQGGARRADHSLDGPELYRDKGSRCPA